MKNNNTEEMKIDVNNEFVKAVLKSTYQYIIDEINGYSNADIRLSKKIAAAKLLHSDELDKIKTGKIKYV